MERYGRVYLKSLEIQGFKSFPDKTVLQFGSDITAIVGPNGSGKSNISDAISWVLGEQSSKALRGAKMEDVIFGGTQKRAPVGFAEATLVLDNSAGAFRVETPEVMITRRYYRSGESEYYINRQSARLRDINELFMDTGLGHEGYSNIGQGRIDEILSRKSTDRREIFEEAAGISKFRHRKEETEKRLAGTEDNLLRIGDKISELELQVEPLRQQAEKAEKYLALRGQLKGLEVTVWLDSLEKLSASAKKAEEDYTSARFILEQAHDELTKLYSQSEQLSLQLNQLSLQLDARREEISGMELEQQKQESEITMLLAGASNHEQNIARVEEELRQQETRSGGIRENIRQQSARIGEIGRELEKLQADIAAAQKNADAITSELEENGRASAAQRARQALLQTELSGKKAEIASLTASMSEVQERRQTLQEDLEAARQRRQETEQQTLECRKALEEAREQAQSAENTIAGYALRLKTRVQKRDDLQKQLDTANVQLQTAQSKIRMLREMERDMEGFSKAVKVVMQEAGRGALNGVHGPVSKLIRVEEEFTTAIETALGAAMQNIVVDSENEGKACINFLKRADAGRATFLPLSTVTGRRMDEGELGRMAGFVGVASALVRTEERYAGIVENLLGRTVIAENLDWAVKMARTSGNRVRIVTLDGQVMNVGGSMTGGSASRSAGVLSRANALEKMEQEAGKLQENAQTLRRSLTEAASLVSKTEYELSAVQGQLREAEDEVLRRTEQQKQTALLMEAVCAGIDSYEQELSRLDRRDGSDSGRLQLLTQQAQALQEQLETLDAEARQLALSRQTLEQRGEAQQASLTALRMDAAAREAERQSAEAGVQQLTLLEQAMQGDRGQKLALMEEYRSEAERLKTEASQKRGEIAALEQRTEEKRAEMHRAVEHRNGVEARRNAAEKSAQEKNQEIFNLERETARLEQKRTTAELEQNQLVDKLWDSYELTPSAAVQARVEIESLTAANKTIGELKRKISALGTPNLGAIEEFQRISERYEYLTGQRDDVLHAKGELENIVKTITQEMTEIFVREFGRINEYFGATFTEMFGGGKASLELEDAKQPLECGIEIRVQPPGKQVKTITLLSGGEKAFVAIALYFAILKVRPTPFCMLDEIDAALDDRNVERYATYLHTLCQKTQFIVITHRRGTMEAADVLYGVTMQEQGISKVLHLELDEMEKQLGLSS